VAAVAHLQIEAIKLASPIAIVTSPTPRRCRYRSRSPVQGLAHRAALIDPGRARQRIAPGVLPVGSDTVYLTTADAAGNVVSFINSLYLAFGSGMVAGDTGIVLQNRGYGFSLDPAHPNCIAPGKRPFHTIIPAMLCKDGRPVVSFGVSGAALGAGTFAVVSNLVDAGRNIQEAIDHPRFNYLDTDRVALERTLAARVGAELTRRGHVVEDEAAAMLRGGFGGGQGIMIDSATGAYWGGSDARKDGCAIGF
jgi:gamma-glutamyltranspeptidase/glutathione hydrolase